MSTKTRGFASMSPEKRRQAAKKGGQTSRDRKVAHRWNSEAAKEASRKGLRTRRIRKGLKVERDE